MEFWVVVDYQDYGYEGFSEPDVIGVYTTKEKAEQAAEKHKTIHHDDNRLCVLIQKAILNK